MKPYQSIAWQCRRGMAEVEQFLLPFYQNHFENLDASNKDLFVELLKETDPDLFNWLLGHRQAPDVFQSLVAQVRGQ